MATTPDYMADFDRLFGDAGYTAYLDGLREQYTADQPTAADTSATQSDLTNPDNVAAMAKQYGWADPTAFKLDMVDPSYEAPEGQFGQLRSAKMTDDAAWQSNNNERNVWRVYSPENNSEFNDKAPTAQGYKVAAGEVPGAKRYTRAMYQYDNDGKFLGVGFESDTKWYEDAAPLIQMGLMAAGMGGLTGGIGASLNSNLGLGLATGGMGEAALGGAALNGGVSALTGQNPVKGALAGAASAAIGKYNPAAKMGVTNPLVGNAINGAVGAGTQAAIKGGDVGEALMLGGIQGASKTFARK